MSGKLRYLWWRMTRKRAIRKIVRANFPKCDRMI